MQVKVTRDKTADFRWNSTTHSAKLPFLGMREGLKTNGIERVTYVQYTSRKDSSFTDVHRHPIFQNTISIRPSTLLQLCLGVCGFVFSPSLHVLQCSVYAQPTFDTFRTSMSLLMSCYDDSSASVFGLKRMDSCFEHSNLIKSE